MSTSTLRFEEYGPNSGFIRDLYEMYVEDPSLVGQSWGDFFKRYEGTFGQKDLKTNGLAKNGSYTNGHHSSSLASETQARVQRFISAYRQAGHLSAKINPLSQGVQQLPSSPLLDASNYNFTAAELGQEFNCDNLLGQQKMRLSEIIDQLPKIYCQSVGFEYTHLMNVEEVEWLRSRIEDSQLRSPSEPFGYNKEQRVRFFKKLVDAEEFESLLHKKYVGQKRFSLQGGETLIAMLDTALEVAAETDIKEVVMGMAHRGRINVLCNTISKPLEDLFTEFEDQSIYSVLGSGDVKYHKGYHSEFISSTGKSVKTLLAPNPSHLEFVHPVVEGLARAKQDLQYDRRRSSVLPIVMHGDAAFSGQGVVYETINYSRVDGYATGGTLHIIVNNQVGFTTNPEEGRSSTYCTDMAKGIEIPVFHVNCEDVEAAQWVIQLAVGFRNTFARDVIVDMYCFRRYGHNEGDDPSFTQPLTYSEVAKKKGISSLYGEQLVSQAVMNAEEVEAYVNDYRARFEKAHTANSASPLGEACAMYGRLRLPSPPTGVKAETLAKIAKTLITYPEDFEPHPKLKQILEKRVQSLKDGKGIDWGFAETLAFGSLILEGHSVRLSGQDCGRGTFSQRHIALNHYKQPRRYLPFSQLSSSSTQKFEVYNSTLSEAGIVGFEFGYSSAAKDALVVWEAQFGDFVNGAQVHVDQFISASESKWDQLSGLVMMLPHGYEGQGSEHSSARLERMLQLCAEGNMCVCYPSNAAQHFHMLRRQGLMDIKRPLIVMTPKSLLRLPEAACTTNQLVDGEFQTVLEDRFGAKDKADVVVFLSGKVYYDVAATLSKLKSCSVKVVRLEQLHPFPQFEVKRALKGLKPKHYLWVQEEPQNMGAYSYLEPYFRRKLEIELEYVGRPAAASPATGSFKRHVVEQKAIMDGILEFVNK